MRGECCCRRERHGVVITRPYVLQHDKMVFPSEAEESPTGSLKTRATRRPKSLGDPRAYQQPTSELELNANEGAHSPLGQLSAKSRGTAAILPLMPNGQQVHATRITVLRSGVFTGTSRT